MKTIFVILFLAYGLVICSSIRTKRIEEDIEEKRVRTKRIGDVETTIPKSIRTKRVGEKKKISGLDAIKTNEEKLQKKIILMKTKIANEQKAALKTKQDTTKNINNTNFTNEIAVNTNFTNEIAVNTNFTNEIAVNTNFTNDIAVLRATVLGPCLGRLYNQTLTAENCADVIIENLVCGGVCDVKPTENNKICTFCGPVDYEERLVFFQCHTGSVIRRRWKMRAKKILTPKKCACMTDLCYKRNRISVEQNRQSIDNR